MGDRQFTRGKEKYNNEDLQSTGWFKFDGSHRDNSESRDSQGLHSRHHINNLEDKRNDNWGNEKHNLDHRFSNSRGRGSYKGNNFKRGSRFPKFESMDSNDRAPSRNFNKHNDPFYYQEEKEDRALIGEIPSHALPNDKEEDRYYEGNYISQYKRTDNRDQSSTNKDYDQKSNFGLSFINPTRVGYKSPATNEYTSLDRRESISAEGERSNLKDLRRYSDNEDSAFSPFIEDESQYGRRQRYRPHPYRGSRYLPPSRRKYPRTVDVYRSERSHDIPDRRDGDYYSRRYSRIERDMYERGSVNSSPRKKDFYMETKSYSRHDRDQRDIDSFYSSPKGPLSPKAIFSDPPKSPNQDLDDNIHKKLIEPNINLEKDNSNFVNIDDQDKHSFKDSGNEINIKEDFGIQKESGNDNNINHSNDPPLTHQGSDMETVQIKYEDEENIANEVKEADINELDKMKPNEAHDSNLILDNNSVKQEIAGFNKKKDNTSTLGDSSNTQNVNELSKLQENNELCGSTAPISDLSKSNDVINGIEVRQAMDEGNDVTVSAMNKEDDGTISNMNNENGQSLLPNQIKSHSELGEPQSDLKEIQYTAVQGSPEIEQLIPPSILKNDTTNNNENNIQDASLTMVSNEPEDSTGTTQVESINILQGPTILRKDTPIIEGIKTPEEYNSIQVTNVQVVTAKLNSDAPFANQIKGNPEDECLGDNNPIQQNTLNGSNVDLIINANSSPIVKDLLENTMATLINDALSPIVSSNELNENNMNNDLIVEEIETTNINISKKDDTLENSRNIDDNLLKDIVGPCKSNIYSPKGLNSISKKIQVLQFFIDNQAFSKESKDGVNSIKEVSDLEKYSTLTFEERYPSIRKALRQSKLLRSKIVRNFIMRRATDKQKEYEAGKRYKSLYDDWKGGRKLSIDKKKLRKRTNEFGKVENALSSSRSQGGFSFHAGDVVRSEKEFQEALASIANEDFNQSNETVSTSADIPPIILNPVQKSLLVMNDSNNLISNPKEHYFKNANSDFWNLEQEKAFLENYFKFPKQFGKIANNVKGKTPNQCVLFYYKNKKRLDIKNQLFRYRRTESLRERRKSTAASTILKKKRNKEGKKNESNHDNLLDSIRPNKKGRKKLGLNNEDNNSILSDNENVDNVTQSEIGISNKDELSTKKVKTRTKKVKDPSLKKTKKSIINTLSQPISRVSPLTTSTLNTPNVPNSGLDEVSNIKVTKARVRKTKANKVQNLNLNNEMHFKDSSNSTPNINTSLNRNFNYGDSKNSNFTPYPVILDNSRPLEGQTNPSNQPITKINALLNSPEPEMSDKKWGKSDIVEWFVDNNNTSKAQKHKSMQSSREQTNSNVPTFGLETLANVAEAYSNHHFSRTGYSTPSTAKLHHTKQMDKAEGREYHLNSNVNSLPHILPLQKSNTIKQYLPLIPPGRILSNSNSSKHDSYTKYPNIYTHKPVTSAQQVPSNYSSIRAHSTHYAPRSKPILQPNIQYKPQIQPNYHNQPILQPSIRHQVDSSKPVNDLRILQIAHQIPTNELDHQYNPVNHSLLKEAHSLPRQNNTSYLPTQQYQSSRNPIKPSTLNPPTSNYTHLNNRIINNIENPNLRASSAFPQFHKDSQLASLIHQPILQSHNRRSSISQNELNRISNANHSLHLVGLNDRNSNRTLPLPNIRNEHNNNTIPPSQFMLPPAVMQNNNNEEERSNTPSTINLPNLDSNPNTNQ